MATEEYSVGYNEGYQDGWNAALEPALPKRELVNLTDEEIEEIAKQLVNDAAYCTLHFAVAIQRKFRKKNNV